MKEYNVIIKLGDEEMDAHIIAKDWTEVCDYVFGNIEIVPKDEDIDIDKE